MKMRNVWELTELKKIFNKCYYNLFNLTKTKTLIFYFLFKLTNNPGVVSCLTAMYGTGWTFLTSNVNFHDISYTF